MFVDKELVAKYALIAFLLLLGYFSFLVISPFFSYLLFSIVLVMLSYPAYEWVTKKIGGHKRVASVLFVSLLIVLIVLPAIGFGMLLLDQAPSAYESFVEGIDVSGLQGFAELVMGPEVDLEDLVANSTADFRNYVVSSAPRFLSSAGEVMLGFFILFFVMYYLFAQGREIMEGIKKVSPLSAKHHEALLSNVNNVVRGVIEGQIVLGLIQGFLAGVVFWVLGVPNALFWGFITAIVSMLPVVGAFMVWLPIAGWLLLSGMIWQGVTLIILGGAVISQIDNVLRPYLVGRYAEVHPALVLIGVLGGMSVFGIVGFILGPLILALFVAFLRFYAEEI